MKTIYKILFSILLITLLVAAIFFFSEQSGADSHTVSKNVSERIADVWADTFWEGHVQYTREVLASMLDAPVRKLAHICIYTALGFGTCIVAHILSNKKIRFWHLLICVLTVALVASLDEFNQYYSGDRGASLSDVFIDSVGGCIGIYLVFVIKDFIQHIINGINREKNIASKK